MESTINCAEACVNGCISPAQCPHRAYAESASKFIKDTSLDQILEMADEAVRKKRLQPPQWVIPEFPE